MRTPELKVGGELIILAMLHSVTAKISICNELRWNSGGRGCANWYNESAFETNLWEINDYKVSGIGEVAEENYRQIYWSKIYSKT